MIEWMVIYSLFFVYNIFKSINCKLFDYDHQIWCDILSFDIDTCYYFENVYLPLSRKSEHDMM